MNKTAEKNIDLWLQGDYDIETKGVIRKLLKENPKELEDAFYTNLSFGTGGLRGIMGVGSNRMNSYTVKAATQGLANYLKTQMLTHSSVFIGYDSRHHSRDFAEVAAMVLAGNGVQVYLFKELRPTPLLSFACRFKHCAAAIMITASHNPPEYNGYKVFWNDGAQILPPHDKRIIEEVGKITDLSMILSVDALSHHLIEIIDTEVDDIYLQKITVLQNTPEINQAHGQDLKIVYTSLHGTGITLLPKGLESWGFTSIQYVEEQIIPDENFPTVKSPNPEDSAALKMGIDLLSSAKADILIATDPDADRVGVAVYHQNKSVILTGNQIACLCLNHLCDVLIRQGKMPEKGAFIKTIVTTELFQRIADYYHKPCFNVLTGFKYIAEKIHSWENDPKSPLFIFGGEESNGYLLGTLTRDKDAIVSSALICEAALQCKLQGKTLVDALHELFRQHGVFYESLHSIKFSDDKAGKETIHQVITHLIDHPPTKISGIEVISIENYFTSTKTYLQTGETEDLNLPKSSALVFWLQDGTKVAIRPSGTEPLIKLYCGVVKKEYSSIPQALQDSEEQCRNILDDFAFLLASQPNLGIDH